MLQIKSRKIMIFSSLLAAFLIIILLSLVRVREVTGQAVMEPVEDKISLIIVFVLIAVIAAALVFLTLMYKQSTYL